MVPRQKIEFRSVLCALLFLSMMLKPLGATVSVGVSKVDVTPTHPVLLAGYGGRTTEHEGVDTPLWARAMVIGQTKPTVIVVLDNCGVTQAIKDRLAKRLAKSDVGQVGSSLPPHTRTTPRRLSATHPSFGRDALIQIRTKGSRRTRSLPSTKWSVRSPKHWRAASQ